MAIEFRCVNCNKLLRVKEESAGKKAKCPECATVLEIPTPGAAPAGDDYEIERPAESPFPNFAAELSPQRPSISANPYQSPAADDTGVLPGQATVSGGPIVPTKMDLGIVMSLAWAIFKSRIWLVVGAILLVGVLNQVVATIAQLIGGMAVENMGETGFVVVIVVQLASMAFGIFLNIGQTMLMLNIARGRKAEIGDVFGGGAYVVPVFLASILISLMVGLGLVLLIIPGIIVALMFSQYYYLIIDKKVGVMESFALSRKVTDGNKLTIFLLGIVSIGVMLLGLLACIVGVLFAAGYIAVILVVAYLTMTGQQIARPQS